MNQILTNDDEVCIPSLSSILIAVSKKNCALFITFYIRMKVQITPRI